MSRVALKVMHTRFRGRPVLPPAVPDRGPLGGQAASHQHRPGLRLRRARRDLLLRHAIYRRRRAGAGARGRPADSATRAKAMTPPRGSRPVWMATEAVDGMPVAVVLARPADRLLRGRPVGRRQRARTGGHRLYRRCPNPRDGGGLGRQIRRVGPGHFGGRREPAEPLVRRPARVGLLPRGGAAGGAGRRRARARAPPGGRPPRHQAVEPPARRPRQRSQGHRLPGWPSLSSKTSCRSHDDPAGTMRFMPPERFRGVTDRRGDIYLAGGHRPMSCSTLRPAFAAAPTRRRLLDPDRATSRRSRCANSDPRIPRDLETLVLKALAKYPADRGSQRLARGSARSWKPISREPPDPVAADPRPRAVLAVVQAESLAGRGQHRRGDPADVPGDRLDRRRMDARPRESISIQNAERTTPRRTCSSR